MSIYLEFKKITSGLGHYKGALTRLGIDKTDPDKESKYRMFIQKAIDVVLDKYTEETAIEDLAKERKEKKSRDEKEMTIAEMIQEIAEKEEEVRQDEKKKRSLFDGYNPFRGREES